MKPNRKLIYIISIVLLPFFALFTDEKKEVNKKWVRNGDYTRVSLPNDYRLPHIRRKTYMEDDLRAVLYAVNFQPGQPVYIEVFFRNNRFPVSLNVTFQDKDVYLTRFDWGYRGFFGISPEEKSSEGRLLLQWSNGIRIKEKHVSILLQKADFPVSTTPLELTKFSDVTKKLSEETLDFIRRSRVKKNKALSIFGQNRIKDRFSHPRDMHYITSEFWAKRIYARYYYKNGKKIDAKPKTSIHRGLDFRGQTGEAVFAIADGRVVLSEKLYYEGNAVFIDHGNRIFSLYLHMNKRLVKNGERIEAGQQIGESGSTGTVTGAHLHLAVFINGVPVNPLSFICLPVRY